MDSLLERRLLMTQYHALANLLHQKGLLTDALTDEELEKLSVADLGLVTRQLRDLARTPSE